MSAWIRAFWFTVAVFMAAGTAYMFFDLLTMWIGAEAARAVVAAFFGCVGVVRGAMRLLERIR